MHIHGNSFSVNAANFYSVGNGERTAAAQRAAQVRKKLLKSAQNVEGEASSDEARLIGQWLDARHSQAQSDAEYETAASGRDPDFG
jgi:hypothetical protein